MSITAETCVPGSSNGHVTFGGVDRAVGGIRVVASLTPSCKGHRFDAFISHCVWLY